MATKKGNLTASQALSVAPQTLYPFEFFDLLGLDTYNPDEIADVRRCVYGSNFRIYNPGDIQTRTALAKRQGHEFYTVPAGETVDQQITSTTGAASQTVGLTTWIAQTFTAGADGNLTKVDVNVKNVDSGTGPLIVALYSDNSGTPGTVLATSSVPNSSFTSSYQYLSARFIEAPTVASSTAYWVVCYLQSDGTNDYDWSSSTSASTAMTSSDSGNTWSSASFEMNLKTYVSTAGGVLGLTRYYRSSVSPVTVFAANTNVYKVNDVTGAVTSIKSGLNASATSYDWVTVNDILYYVNTYDAPRKWDGTTEAAVGGSPPTSCQVELYTNHVFYLQPSTNYVVYSEAGTYETFDATAFLYVPSPKTADPVIKMVAYGGNLSFITRNTKYTLFGSDISSFTVKEATAKRGAVSADAVCTDQQFIYFMSDDYHIYAYNGGTDTKLSSERVSAILRNIANKSSIKLYVHDKKLFVSYTPSGHTTNHHRLVWDLVFAEWMNDEDCYTGFGIELNSQSDTNQWVLGSSKVGALYYGDEGYNDLGRPIAFNWWSKYLSYGTPAAKKRVKRHYVFLQAQNSNQSVDCQVDTDDANAPSSNPVSVEGTGSLWGTATWGAFTWGSTNFVRSRQNVPGQYYKYQYRFVQSGVDNPVGIVGWTDYILPIRPR